MIAISNDLEATGGKLKVLADIREMDAVKLGARKAGVDWLKTANYYKVAAFGNSMFTKYFVNMLVQALGNPMRYFTSREEAEAWLKE